MPLVQSNGYFSFIKKKKEKKKTQTNPTTATFGSWGQALFCGTRKCLVKKSASTS